MKTLTKILVFTLLLTMALALYGCGSAQTPTVDLDEKIQATDDTADVLEGSDTSAETTAPNAETPVDVTEAPTTTPTEASAGNISGIRPEFQVAMASYEEFMDKYVDFMKKYNESNGTDLTLLADYETMMSDYTKFSEEFAKWSESELNEEETKYYIEVQTRVNEKLLEVAA